MTGQEYVIFLSCHVLVTGGVLKAVSARIDALAASIAWSACRDRGDPSGGAPITIRNEAAASEQRAWVRTSDSRRRSGA